MVLITAISGCGKKGEEIIPVPTPIYPVVTASYPPGDTLHLFVRNHAIIIVFSTAMDRSSVQSAFSANGAAGNFYWQGNEMTFVPDTAFSADTTVTVSITGNALDLAGTGLNPAFSSWYRTSDSLDSKAPTVWAQNPLPDSQNISIGTDVMAYASEELIDWSTNSLTLTDSAGVKVTGNTALALSATALNFMPSSALKYNTRYYVTIDTTLRDMCWNRLAAQYTWTFRTEKDLVKPTVVSVSPAAGDTNVTVNTSITVCFSEPMDHNTAQAALSLTPAVAFYGYSWQGDTLMTATLADTLSFKKQYRINISTAALDVSGNQLASSYSAGFSTLRGLLVLCNTANEIYSYQQADLKFEGYLRPYSSPRQIRISADDSLAYVLTQNGVEFIQLKNQNNHLGTVNLPQTCYGLALSPNGLQLAVTDTTNDSLYIISTATMQKTGSVKTGGIPKGVCFNQGGKVAVLCWGKVEIYTSSLALQYTTIVPNNGEELVKGNGDTLYAASGTGISAISFGDGSKVFNDLTGLSNHPFGLAFSPDGAHLALACYDENAVKVYTTSGTYVTTAAAGTRPKGLCYSPDGTKLYVLNSGSSNVSVITRSGNTYTLLSTVTVGSGPWGIAVTP
ncbi:Ig-like domain-containing protein [candidate division TA06 bacterium]|nr:Ig-like domain-containing protein [candidate division TA06 bacterium]